ncbi:hypothetical protein ACIBSV_05080 [Embleya sp. NPDC050154]|uniref:hypothetical protein n=1 Tax=unclassified Embleya TaxID=2699296 RepID=UPI00379E656A
MKPDRASFVGSFLAVQVGGLAHGDRRLELVAADPDLFVLQTSCGFAQRFRHLRAGQASIDQRCPAEAALAAASAFLEVQGEAVAQAPDGRLKHRRFLVGVGAVGRAYPCGQAEFGQGIEEEDGVGSDTLLKDRPLRPRDEEPPETTK